MYGRILVGIGASAFSDAALTEALNLARAVSATVRVAFVVDSQTPGGVELSYADQDAYRASIMGEAQEIIRHAEVVARGAGATVESTLLEGPKRSAATRLVEEAKRWSADLIVMGTHGRRGLARALIGSVAESVVRTSPVPVMTVHAAG